MTVERRIIDFIEKHRIAVLTTITASVQPHSAAMHYASKSDPLKLIFLTKRKSRKCSHFVGGHSYPASVVIGFSEEEWVELQMEGTVRITDDGWSQYAEKYPGTDKYKDSGEDVLLEFEPTWWKYSEFKPKPPKIITSDEHG